MAFLRPGEPPAGDFLSRAESDPNRTEPREPHTPPIPDSPAKQAPPPDETPAVPPSEPESEPEPERKNGEKKNARKKARDPVGNIEALGTPNVPEFKSNVHTLTIIGQIEGHLALPPQNKTTKYEHLIPQLVAVEQNPEIEGLLIILNTVGGDVEAGLALSEMIRSLSKPTVSLVLGGGHSIGVPIAVSSTHSFIASTATMTIHPIRLTGLVISVPQTYEYLDKMQDRVIRFVVENSRCTEEKFRELMFRTGELARDIGTVLVGPDAVSVGLIDQVGGLSEAVSKLNQLIAERRKGAGGEAHSAAAMVGGGQALPHPLPPAEQLPPPPQ